MLKRFFSFTLLVLFLIETSPNELWHLFAHHHDTHDTDYSQTTVGSAHIHCQALCDFLPDYTQASHINIPSAFEHPFKEGLTGIAFVMNRHHAVASDRGPPIC